MSEVTQVERAGLAEALAQIDKLEDLIGGDGNGDNNANVEAHAGPIVYQVDFDTNFEDRGGFVTGIAKYMEEGTVHSKLNELLVEGEQYAVTLYTWRCCSRGIPQPKSDEDPHRVEIYEKTVEVLAPEVEKLFNLMKFQKKAIEMFCQQVKVLCHSEKKKEFVSESYLLTLGKSINMFAILDELKNIKSSVKNDFSTYKRAAQFLKLSADVQALQESQNLSMFLATQNKIRNSLKKTLMDKVPNYTELLADIVNISVSMFESKLYLTQSEKHMLVKVIGFCLDLMDNERCSIYKLDHKKKIRLEKIDRIFRAIEVVPLFGDMQISPFQYVQRSTHFEPNKWPLCMSAASSTSAYSGTPGHIDLVKLLPQITADHLKYACQLQEATTSLDFLDPMCKSNEKEEDNDKLCQLALEGLQHLSEWTTAVSELCSWKLLHPTDHHQNSKCPPEAEEYERATRYNYTDEEKSALVQVLAIIKSLQLTLAKMEGLFMDAIRRDVYSKLQTFIQITLREPIRKAIKHKKIVLKSILLSIRDTCADWVGSGDWAVLDPALKGEKTPADLDLEVGKRVVRPSSTQLYLLRTMLESLVSEKTCANRTLRKDLNDKHIPLMEQFYKKTFFWSYLFNFGEMLQRCADLSQLWYREFYLEMTMGKRIQFPIEMSMPWILMDHVLNNPVMIEYALYPLDLYNDSCHYALNVFRKQYLYDELEAEVNLCFDQFVYKLSEQIFSFYKKEAAASLLDKKFRANCMSIEKKPFPSSLVIPYRYGTLMMQRRVYLLGHYIDLNKLIRQRVCKSLLESLNAAITKFQEGDLTNIVQLEALIAINRETHKALKKVLPGLDDFDWILREANNNVTTPHGRITFHVFCELIYDFLPSYCYNGATNRFVKSDGTGFSEKAMEHRAKPTATGTTPQHYLWGSKQLSMAYTTIFGQYTGFIGFPHFRAIASLLGYQGIAVVIQEILKVIQGLIDGSLLEHVKDLIKVVPKNSTLPIKILSEAGSPGILDFYFHILSGIMQHPNIRVEIFQQFREVGNALLFCLMIEQSLAQLETWQLFHTVPFTNISASVLRNFNQTGPGNEHAEKKETEAKAATNELSTTMHVLGNLNRFGTEIQRSLAKEGDLLSRERLCCGLSIFQQVLKEVQKYLLKDPIWKGESPKNNVMQINEGTEFYRIWSCLQFVFCLPLGQHELTAEQLYGDSINWAGCLFISLLGQRQKFEVFDFCYRLLESHRADRIEKVLKGISLKRMAIRIRTFQVLNSQIFCLLDKHIQENMRTLNGTDEIELVNCFPPPIHKTLARVQPVQAASSKTSLRMDTGDVPSPVYEELKPSTKDKQEKEPDTDDQTFINVLYQHEQKPDGQESTTNICPSAPAPDKL